MPDDESTLWIEKLIDGNQRAAQAIWEGYFDKLVRLAKKRLKGIPRRAADEEDVALSAMNSFFRGAEAGRFPRLNDRADLWKLLVKITARKAMAQQRRHFAEKRGAGQVRGESIFENVGESEGERGIAQVVGSEPTPEFAAMIAESCGELIERLGDETLRTIALKKIECYTNEEIAQQLDIHTRTVERKLERIRSKWTQESAE